MHPYPNTNQVASDTYSIGIANHTDTIGVTYYNSDVIAIANAIKDYVNSL